MFIRNFFLVPAATFSAGFGTICVHKHFLKQKLALKIPKNNIKAFEKALAVKKKKYLRGVCSSLQSTFLAFSASLEAAPIKKTVKEGAFGFFEMLMISFNLGTPSVTFLEDTPAKWKVFSVI